MYCRTPTCTPAAAMDFRDPLELHERQKRAFSHKTVRLGFSPMSS